MFRHLSSSMQLLLIALVLASGLPMAELALANDTTAFGCTITAKKPGIEDGQLIANATVECSQALQGRIVVTELLQKRSDGTYEAVFGASSTMEAPEELLEPADGDPYEADTNPVGCRQIGDTREFRTLVKVGDGSGNFEEIRSGPEPFNKDCLEGDQTQPVSVSEDEVIEEACTGDFCTASHLENTGRYYGCLVISRNPVALGDRLVGDGEFECDTRLIKRYAYAQVCDDIARLADQCFGLTNRYIDRRNANWTVSPYCIATPITKFPPVEYRGTYTRAGIDPGKQENGDNPRDRHENSPRTPFESDCSRSPLG